jgi:hypothetical protein
MACGQQLRNGLLGLARSHPVVVTVAPASIALLAAVILDIAGIGFVTALWLFASSCTLYALAAQVVHSCSCRNGQPPSRDKAEESASGVELGEMSKTQANAGPPSCSSTGETQKIAPSTGADSTASVGGIVGTYNICFVLWLAVLAFASALFVVVAAIDAALLTPPEVADHICALIVAASLSATCGLVVFVAASSTHASPSPKSAAPAASAASSSPEAAVAFFDALTPPRDRCAASPGCFRCCSVLGLPLVLALSGLLLYNEISEVHGLVTLPMPGQLVTVDDGSEYPPTHLLCDDNGATPGDGRPTVLVRLRRSLPFVVVAAAVVAVVLGASRSSRHPRNKTPFCIACSGGREDACPLPVHTPAAVVGPPGCGLCSLRDVFAPLHSLTCDRR